MEICEIVRGKNHMVTLCMDDGSAVSIDCEYAAELCLKAGDSVSEEKLSEITKESEYIRAKSRGLYFLDRADHSEKALFDKIVKGRISESAAARAIARFKQLGLVDDRRYAERLAERMSESNISKREAYMKLSLKGVQRDIINEVLSETEFDEAAQIAALIDKKYAHRMNGEKEIKKVYDALVRKGFSYSAVREVLKLKAEELEYEDV